MTSRNRTILLIFVLFLLAIGVTAAYYFVWGPDSTSTTPVIQSPARRRQRAQRVRADDLVTPQKVRSWYALKPDGRFIAAFGEVDQFLGIKDAPAPKFTFHDDHWTLDLPGMEAAKLPLYPDFPELEAILEQYASMRLKEAKLTVSTEFQAPEGKMVKQYLSGAPLKALQTIDEDWKAHKNSAFLISEAARSLALLNFQLMDLVGAGTPVHARALAVLALAKTATREPQDEAETLLSYAFGYTEHSKKIAAHLPLDHPIRLYALRQDTNLRSMAVSASGNGFTKFLYLQRLADSKNEKEWAKSLQELFPELEAGLPLLKTGIDLREFAEKRVLGPRISLAALAELSQFTGRNNELAAILKQNRIDAFDSVLAAVNSEGPFANSELIRSYYTSYFFSGLYTQGLFYLDSLSSMEDSVDFAQKLGHPGSELGREFATWYSHLAQSKMGKMKWEALYKDVLDLHHLGPNQISRTIEEAADAPGAGLKEEVKCARKLASMLDTRPAYRLMLGRKMYSFLADLKATNNLYASFVQCCKDFDQQAFVWYSKFTGNVRELLKSTELDQKAKTDVFSYMIRSKDKTPEEITEAYKELIFLYPGDYHLTRNYADYLIKSNKVAEGESLLREWIESHSWDEKGFDYIFARTRLANILRDQERYDEAWKAVQPVVSSYQSNAMIEAALVLDRMGKSEDAIQMARKVLERYPDGASAVALNLRLFWQAGNYAKAAEFLKHYPMQFSRSDFCHTIAEEYARVFASRPKKEGIKALSGLTTILAYKDELYCFAVETDYLKNPGLAFAITEFLISQDIRSDYDLIEAYRYKRNEAGKEVALAWLRQAIPPNTEGTWIAAAFGMDEYDLLWEIGPEEPKGEWAEFTWLERAEGCVRVNCGDAQRAKLKEHFSRKSPSVNTLYCGRFLMDMIPAQQLQDIAFNNSMMLEVAYNLGLKAESNGDYEAASDWYRVAMETEQANQPYYPWTHGILEDWRDTGRNLDYIKKHPHDE